jgi:2-C-methyl-D-erythritol 4-phosphate cytidylyltransferase
MKPKQYNSPEKRRLFTSNIKSLIRIFFLKKIIIIIIKNSGMEGQA